MLRNVSVSIGIVLLCVYSGSCRYAIFAGYTERTNCLLMAILIIEASGKAEFGEKNVSVIWEKEKGKSENEYCYM